MVMKWETMPRGYFVPQAHTDTNQPTSNPESPTLGGEGIPLCLNTGALFTTPLLLPKAKYSVELHSHLSVAETTFSPFMEEVMS